jgi:hypothetical protein
LPKNEDGYAIGQKFCLDNVIEWKQIKTSKKIITRGRSIIKTPKHAEKDEHAKIEL